MNGRRWYIPALILLLIWAAATALQAHPGCTRPKVGLALSGGGAKGFAHIGVLKVIEEAGLPIDCIAGSSIGSIIGGLYAIGYSPAEMESLATEIDWSDFFSDSRERRYLAMVEKQWDSRYIATLNLRQRTVQLPAGLVTGQKISSLFSRLTWPVHHINNFSNLPIPFVCIATDIESGEAVPLRSGFLPEALRASMAIPTLFTPMLIDSLLLVDGGLTRNLPASDVRELGADYVIGVDVGAPLKTAERLDSFIAIMDQALSLQAAKSTQYERDLCKVLIVPELGNLNFSDFEQVGKFVELGEQAARAHLDEFRALLDSLKVCDDQLTRPVRSKPAQFDSIFVYELELTGMHRLAMSLVKSELGIKPPQWIAPADLEKRITRIFSSLSLDRVTYQLTPSSRGTKLSVNVLERDSDQVRLGLRYDSRTEATILLNTTFRNLTGMGSALAFDLELAGKTEFDAQYFVHTRMPRSFGLHFHARLSERPLDVYDRDTRTARFDVRSIAGDLFWGSIFHPSFSIGLGYRIERARTSPNIAPEPFGAVATTISSGYGQIRIDTFDRGVFPQRGHQVRIEAERAIDQIGGSVDFTSLSLDARSYFRVNRHISILTRLQLGHMTAPDSIPLHRQFFLGGDESFYGLRPQELAGANLQSLTVGVQFEPWRRRFIILRWNVGNTFPTWALDVNRSFFTGAGITAGLMTPIGPLDFTYAFGNRHNSITHLNLGFRF